MANHVSALKRARQTVTRTEVNRANRSRVRTSLRTLREAIAKGDVEDAQTVPRHRSALDKSVQKGVLHSNTVSRYKSRLNARLKRWGPQPRPLRNQSRSPSERPGILILGAGSNPGALILAGDFFTTWAIAKW